MLDLILFLQNNTTGATPEQGQSQWSFWIMMLLIVAVFYFFMIRPQTKKQKELQSQREAMKKDDKVITAGGIYGIIKEVQDTTFIIEVSKGVTLKVDKNSVYASAEDANTENAEKK